MNLKTVRLVKIVVVAMAAFYASFVVLGNLMDYGSNYQFVKHVVSMDTTFQGNGLMWRAVTSPALITIIYWLIIAAEAMVAVFGWMAVGRMTRHLSGSNAAFDGAKKWGYYAFLLGLGVWFIGFICIGSEWFAMWQSSIWNGKQTAMDISEVFIGLLIVYMLPERFTTNK